MTNDLRFHRLLVYCTLASTLLLMPRLASGDVKITKDIVYGVIKLDPPPTQTVANSNGKAADTEAHNRTALRIQRPRRGEGRQVDATECRRICGVGLRGRRCYRCAHFACHAEMPIARRDANRKARLYTVEVDGDGRVCLDDCLFCRRR